MYIVCFYINSPIHWENSYFVESDWFGKRRFDIKNHFIFRRNGLVPLSSLCKDASTVLPTNVKFISGRNVRLGKPGLYVKDSGRILAIGGSRQKPADPIYPNVSPAHSFKVVNVPRLVKKPDEDFQVRVNCYFESFPKDKM